MRIAFDPTPLHAMHAFLEFTRATAGLGNEWVQLTPHRDFQLAAIRDAVAAAKTR